MRAFILFLILLGTAYSASTIVPEHYWDDKYEHISSVVAKSGTELNSSPARTVMQVLESKVEHTCLAPPTSLITSAPSVISYQWTENGRAHFGDSPPSHVDATAMNFKHPTAVEYFQLKIDYDGHQPIPFLQNKLTANTNAIYEVLSTMLSKDKLRQVELNIRIFESRNDYQHYARSVSGERIANAGGFYSPRTNEAVTFKQSSDEETLAVSRHEAVHVIVNGLMGRTPTWLNEGLAEYFEQIKVSGQFSQVEVNQAWLRLAREAINNGYPQSLTDYLNVEGNDWYENSQHVHYALAWSLTYFLMSSDNGRQIISTFMQTLADNYCMSVNSSALLSHSYPGGINQLENDFFSWIRGTRVKPNHRY